MIHCRPTCIDDYDEQVTLSAWSIVQAHEGTSGYRG